MNPLTKNETKIIPNYGNMAVGVILAYVTFKFTPQLISVTKSTYQVIQEKAPHMSKKQMAIAGALASGVVIPWFTIGFVYYMHKMRVKK